MSEELNLSFVQTKKQTEKPVASGVIDLKFLETKDPGPTVTAEQIVRQRNDGGFPQGDRSERGFFEKFPDVVTGRDRETNATRALPELGTDISLQEFMGDRANFATASAALVTPDPVEMVKILSEQAGGELNVRPDEAGNIILGLDGKEAILNKPGFTYFDALQLGGLMSAFTPAGRAGLGAPTILQGGVRVGAASGATQAGIETLQADQGGNFGPGDVALTAAAGGVLHTALQKIAQSFPALVNKVKNNGVTEEVRSIYNDVAVKLGLSTDDITDDLILSSVDDVAKAVTPEESLAIHGEREFRVPLTKGQRTLDDAQLSFEDRARAGVAGEKPQRVMLGFERENQMPAINAALEVVEGRLGVSGADRGVIREGVKTAERAADDAVGEAYDRVGSARLTVDGMKTLTRRVRNSVRGTEYDRTLPQTAKLIEEANKLSKAVKGLEGSGLRGPDLTRLEQMRRRINTALSAADNPADKRQVTIMKREFDDYLDEAVQDALFSGDDATLANLKEARSIFSEYAKKFRAQPKRGKSGRIVDSDEPGAFVEKIIDANPTDEQIVNAVFGASGFSKGSGAGMARRFKNILGEDSEGWREIRREALRRLIVTTKVNGNDVVSGSKTLTAIDKAMEKNGSLVKEIFTKDEISLIRRFGAHVKRTQPDLVRSRENPSGTAQVAAKSLSDVAKRLGSIFAVGGEPAVFVTAKGIQTAGNITKGAKAADAIRPFRQLKDVKPEAVGAAVGAVESARN